MLRLEVAEQRPRGHRDFAHAPFDEVARGCGLGKHHEIDRGIELRQLRQHRADALQVDVVLPLGGADLSDGEAGHGEKDRRVDG